MIELRWFEHPSIPYTDLSGNSGMCAGVTVLQYRQFQLGTDASGALTPAGSPGWGEWHDVPTVKG